LITVRHIQNPVTGVHDVFCRAILVENHFQFGLPPLGGTKSERMIDFHRCGCL